MGYELYCGDRKGTVKILSTVSMGVIARDLTPSQVEEFMYKLIAENTLHSVKYFKTAPSEHILGLFHDSSVIDESYNLISGPKNPVLNTPEHIKRYAKKCARIWKKSAIDKVNECKALGMEHGEAIHTIEYPSGKNRLEW